MRIESLYEEFLIYLNVERNCSPLTVEAYGADLKTLKRALAELDVTAEVEAIDRRVVRHYVVWMREQGLSAATVARKINSLRSFWNYLLDNELTETNPLRGAVIPKQARRLPGHLSAEECLELIAAAAGQDSRFLSCRDRALLSFLLFTGARRGEVLNLEWSHVDLRQHTVRFVAAKGAKTRVVPLAEDVVRALGEWMDIRPECAHDCVFTTQWGARLGKRGIPAALRRAMRAAGISKPEVTVHTLRHSFACLMLRNGADLSCIQKMLGHTRLDTTGIYLDATAEDLRDAVAKHPLSSR
jgi:site-specific recombinase XerD